MNRQRYYKVCRTLIVATTMGQFLAVLLAVIAIQSRAWHILPPSIAGYIFNLMIAGIVIADGVKRFGDRNHG